MDVLHGSQEQLVYPQPPHLIVILWNQLELWTEVEHDVRQLRDLDIAMAEDGRREVLVTADEGGEGLDAL